MSQISRRSFLGTSSVVAAAAVGSVVATRAIVGPTDDDVREAFDGIDPALGTLPEMAGTDADDRTVIVHIVDPGAGEISAYVGDQLITFTDRALVDRVMKAGA